MSRFSVHKVLSAALLILGVGCALLSHAAPLEQQREWYEEAGIALENNKMDKYRQLRDKLDDYPLSPYLDYREFSRRLKDKTPEQVEAFINEHKTLPFSTTIKERYLALLANTNRWQNFIDVQPMPPGGELLKCHYYYAQSKLGNTAVAWQGAQSLWLTGKSISDACDPLLAKWQKAGQRTDTLILDRMLLVYAEGNSGRLKYLNKQLSEAGKAKGGDILALFDKPEQVSRFAKRSRVTPFNQDLTVISYKRLARKDIKEAVKQYQAVMDGQHFSKAKRQVLADYSAARLFSTEKEDLLRWRDSKIRTSSQTHLLERRIRLAIREADWQGAEEWIKRLPQEAKQTTRWTFWQAHLLAQKGQQQAAEKIYTSLLGQRDFYSVAAATVLKKPIHYPVKKVPETLKYSQAYAVTLTRVKELIALDKIFAANREWTYLLNGLDNEQVQILASYAAANKWHHLAVQATISGQLWDHIELRFPIAHKWWFDFFSKRRGLPATTMMALARQESAWNVDAQSPVGARGLMQLMPATAKDTAKKLGRNYQGKRSLFDPGVNIRLGSGYLKMMLDRYDNNRVYAFAAYNAGPTRVNRWREGSDSTLDVFAFIEAIPFSETRGYVQNVLMFEVYYGDLIGKKTSLLNQNELSARY